MESLNLLREVFVSLGSGALLLCLVCPSELHAAIKTIRVSALPARIITRIVCIIGFSKR